MKKLNSFILVLLICFTVISVSCDKNNDIVLFSINNDISLGQQVAAEIESMPEQFPILERSANLEAYEYIENMMNVILASGSVSYRTEFPWKVNIIDDPEVLNAFATPGGQIYVYTGLIFFLEREDHLAGVMGHEIAHADQRHSSKQLQRQYGVSVLLSIITGGDPGLLTQIATSLGTLKFSRDAEAEADDYSVLYLADVNDFACNGAAGFFQKLLDSNSSSQPEFLSTHPSPDNRVEDINAKATEEGCDTSLGDDSISDYDAFKASLPQ
ncbi:Peptidase family M48 [Ekhidna lutea]|uniref:Peptidase family M48 n=1 Tax=Ekhidna lutea TaxID=447679 RepID=A0A239ED44_EKHLU|nr:M48 family metalloprotease [Ekhidna lutea]SNS42527.1 Peptidase family M48 [Ekhidna lutea]